MAAVDMLFLMGCNPIILAGQDLSYKDNRNYADEKTNTITYSNANTLISDVDIYGNKVLTDYGYKSMQNDMEMQNIKYGNLIKMYNATEGGLDIHGIENVRFSDVYEKHIKNRMHDVGKRLSYIVGKEDREDKGSGDGNDNNSGKSITEFISHLLEKCTETENLINQKNEAFIPFARLIERGVSNNRINNEMRFIQDYNKKLNDIDFFKHVVMPNVDPSLAYFRASGRHIADSGQDWEGAAIFEQKLNEFALEYINNLKIILLREMVGDINLEIGTHESITA
jgi:hypothetical protein